jgi:hypothetical protein
MAARLQNAIVAYRLGGRGGTGTGGRASNNNGLAARCDRRIRASLAVLAAEPITCGLCVTNFEPADAEAS